MSSQYQFFFHFFLGALSSSQFPVFTLYAQKVCLSGHCDRAWDYERVSILDNSWWLYKCSHFNSIYKQIGSGFQTQIQEYGQPCKEAEEDWEPNFMHGTLPFGTRLCLQVRNTTNEFVQFYLTPRKNHWLALLPGSTRMNLLCMSCIYCILLLREHFSLARRGPLIGRNKWWA